MTVYPTHVRMVDPVLMASIAFLVHVPRVSPEIPVKLVSKTVCFALAYEPRREKTGFLPMRKQRRRSASR